MESRTWGSEFRIRAARTGLNGNSERIGVHRCSSVVKTLRVSVLLRWIASAFISGLIRLLTPALSSFEDERENYLMAIDAGRRSVLAHGGHLACPGNCLSPRWAFGQRICVNQRSSAVKRFSTPHPQSLSPFKAEREVRLHSSHSFPPSSDFGATSAASRHSLD